MAKKEKTLLTWPKIALALVLVWPVGLAMVIMKFKELNGQFAGKELLPEGAVPFKDEKTTAQIKIYRGHIKSQKQKRSTALATMVIGMLVACAGITYFYVQGFTRGFDSSILPSIGACALFAMAGIMQGIKGYDMLKESKRLALLAALIDDRRVVTEVELQEGSGLSREEVRGCLQVMFDRCYFADGVHADEEAGTFICCK